jgi:hypothetical protein
MRSAQQEWIDALAGDGDLFEQQLGLYDKMRVKLGLVGAAWQVANEHTRENAARLAFALDNLRDYSQGLANTRKPIDEFTQNMLKAGNAIRAQQDRLREGGKSVGEFIDRLAEMNEVVEDDDPLIALGSLMEQFKLLAASGEYSAAALLKSFAPRVTALEEELDKLGISLPQPFEEFIGALQGPGAGLNVLESFIKGIREELPDAQAIAAAAMKSGFEDVRSSIRDARGDLNALGQDLEALSKEVVIKIKVDESDLQEWRRRNGGGSGEPATGGQVP